MSDGRHIPFYESNLLGGASVINGCVHMFGSKSKWESILKTFNADYGELLDSYNRLYSSNQIKNNKITLNPAPQNIIDNSFIKTLNLHNIPTGDMNFSDRESCGPILNTVKKYFRSSILSIIQNQLFVINSGEIVEDILFDDNGKVTGVKTNLRSINSDYVILAAGVIGTCDILLREKHKEGNNVLRNLIVGRGIQDHTNLRVNVFTNNKFDSLNEISNSFYKKIWLLIRHFFGKPTLLKGTGATSAAHLDLNKDGEIDTRIQIVQFTENGRFGSDGSFFSRKPGFSISITAINPESSGEIILEGLNNIVNPMFLSSGNDIELLKMALEYSLKLLRSSPLSDHILEIEDVHDIENDTKKYIVNNIFSGHHLIGGSYDAINSNFEVHNTKRLYVCDASVFSKYAASNVHSSVVLIADIFSKKFISNNY